MNPPSIIVDGVSKIYETDTVAVTALSDVSFSVKNGERIGIIGENGAGKSTLLQILAGVNEPTRGRVEINGKVHAALTVGMGAREEATGRENLYLDGAIQGKTRREIDARVNEMIEFAELGEFIDRPMRTYSSGMKARLVFASLVFVDPEILIIDEALSVGDAQFAGKASRVIRDLCARGKIVLIVSHSLASIREMCDRCLWFDHGKLRADGSPEEVTSAYRDMVNQREAADIDRKFGKTGRSWSVDSDVTIESIAVVPTSDTIPKVLLHAGTDVELRLNLTIACRLKTPRLRIWVERNDGLILLDESLPLTVPEAGFRSARTHLRMGWLDWRPFMYQIHAEIADGTQTLAHSATSLKIISDDVILGGQPVLRRPPLVKSEVLS